MTSASMENMNTATDHETETKPEVFYLGSLQDLGLGNPEGIPSKLADKSDDERKHYGEQLVKALDTITDYTHYGCIDGRNCVHNADGSQPEVRNRQVGGTGLLVEVALNGEAPIVDTLKRDGDTQVRLKDAVKEVELDFAAKTGVRRSAHLGGCGGVKGAVADNKNMHAQPTSVNVASALMEIPAVRAYSGLAFSEELGARVREQAGKTAEWLEAEGWDGDKYVEKTQKHEPAGVEDLEVDAADEKFHGHKEEAVVFVLSLDGSQSLSERKLKELGLGEAFVVNVNASVDAAKAQAGNRGEEGAAQLLIANFAKHAEVANRLASTTTPVYLIVA